jgi:acyl carrier protein
MNESELRELICEMFLGGDSSFPIEAQTQLLEEGICDSLGLVQMAAELERRCPGVRIRDQEVTRENLGTMAAILAFLASKGR